jgi:hypothetical protein
MVEFCEAKDSNLGSTTRALAPRSSEAILVEPDAVGIIP